MDPTTPATTGPFWSPVMGTLFFLAMAVALMVLVIYAQHAIAALRAELDARKEAGDG